MWSDKLPERVPGLSARTSIEILRAERRSPVWEVHGGSTSLALNQYRAFVASPRPVHLLPIDYSCPGCCLYDVRHARTALDGVLVELPPRARAELGRVVRALDKRYLGRTLPDPSAQREDEWWFRRLVH